MGESPARPARYNPFAFPSDIDFAFWLLVAVILGTSLLVYLAVANSVAAGFEPQAALNARCEARAGPIHANDSLQDRQGWLAAFQACENVRRPPLGWVAAGMAVLWAGAAAIYLLTPAWKIRRGNLVPLTADEAPEIAEELRTICRTAGVAQPPTFVWNPLNTACGGVAFGLPRRRFVALSGGLSTKLWTDPDAFRAVVLHELAHLQNGDVDKAYSTVAIWWSFVITALLPFALVIRWSDLSVTPRRVFSLVTLALVVYLLRNAALRARETYADVRASAWPGFVGGLERTLPPVLPPVGGWRRLLNLPREWLSRHPRPAARREAVRDTTPLFRAGFWIAAGTGVAGSLALVNVQVVANLVVPAFGDWVAALLFGALVVGVVGLALWRTTFVVEARGGRARGMWRPAVGLAGGLAAGDLLSLSASASVPAGFALTGADLLVFDLLWYGLLFIGSVLFLRWIVACASTWLPVVTRRDSPRIAYALGFLPAVLVLTVGLEFLFYVAPVRLTGGILPASLIVAALSGSGGLAVPSGPYLEAGIVLVFLVLQVATSPVFYVAVQLLWVVPLAAWLHRRRAAPLLTARWALMDPPTVASPGPTPPALRPGRAAVAGLVGGLLFCGIAVPVSLALWRVAPDSLVTWLLYGQTVLGILVQVGVAIAVALWVGRLGAVHGLFAAFVCGCVIAVGALAGAALTLSLPGLRVHGFAATTVTAYLNVGALVTVPAAAGAAAFASWARRAAALPAPVPARS